MLRLIWRQSAQEDLDKIVLYIAGFNFDAALRLQNLFESSAEQLSHHPYMFRIGQVIGTREAVVHANYKLIYKVTADAVEIVNVVHSRQQYPPGEEA